MTQRAREEEKKRLVALMEQSPVVKNYDCTWHEYFSALADDLLSNGVLVLPCKIGDTVYSIGWGDNEVHEDRVSWFAYDSTDHVFCFQTQSTDQFTAEDIGKTIFFTYKEAESALKERSRQ